MDTNIQKYMAFIKTIEYGSFTKAAEMLNYSQSGISRMIATLEKEWNVSLLDRSHSGVRLTSDGMMLYQTVQRICSDYENLQMQIDDLNGLHSGLIRIGTFSSVATFWLPNIIDEFQKDYPNIDYEVSLGSYVEIQEWIFEGKIDCGFLLLPTHPDLEATFLETDQLLLVLPEGHPLTRYEKVPIELIKEYPFMLSKVGVDSEVVELLQEDNLEPDVHLTTWDDYAIMAMVEKGLGIGILSGLILKRCPFRVILKEFEVPAYRRIGVAYRSKKTMSLATKHFLQYLEFRKDNL